MTAADSALAAAREGWAANVAQTEGTDVALLMGMLHVVLRDDLHDQPFIAAHTTGFDAVAESVKGFDPKTTYSLWSRITCPTLLIRGTESWASDPIRRAEVGIPPTVQHQPKTDLALACLDRVRAWGLQLRPVLADSEFGNSWDVRQGLHTRGYPYCVQVEATTGAWPTPPIPPDPLPTTGRGRPRTRPRRTELPTPQPLATLARALPTTAWRTVTWRAGTKGPLTSRFARFPVWCAHEYQRGGPCAPREETCLVEWPAAELAPTKYWLADLRGEPLGLRRLVRHAKGRWRIEQDYRELKDELGLDHFEGRSWTGWHHHVTLVSMAYAFLVLERARTKKNLATDLAPDPAPAPIPAAPVG